MAAEIADLQSVLDELWERVDELKEAAASSSSTKSALKAAFAQMAAARPASSSPPSPSAGVLSAAPISLFLLIFYLLPAPNFHIIQVNCHSKGSNILVNSHAFSTYKGMVGVLAIHKWELEHRPCKRQNCKIAAEVMHSTASA